MKTILVLIPFLLFPLLGCAAGKANLTTDSVAFPNGYAMLRADRAALLAGVDSLRYTGSPGRSLAVGGTAIQLYVDTDGFSAATAARHGAGRVLVLTHDSFPAEAATHAGTARFLNNALAWLHQGKKQGKMYSIAGASFAKYCRSRGIACEEGLRVPARPEDYSLIHVGFSWKAAEQLTADETERLQRYVAKGGALYGTAIAWVWKYYSEPGKAGRDIRESALNRLFAPLGIVLCDWYIKNPRLATPADCETQFYSLLRSGIADLGREMSPGIDRLNALTQAVGNLIDACPASVPLFTDRDAERIMAEQRALGARIMPRDKQPVLPADGRAANAIVLVDALQRRIAPEKVIVLPTTAEHPGAVTATAQTLTKTLVFGPGRNGRWQSTGLYAPAGRIIEARLLSAAAAAVTLQIGCHKDNLQTFYGSITGWRRWPNMILREPLTTDAVRLASPLGGLIYVEIPENNAATIVVNIAGGVAAPHYVRGATGMAEWQTMVRASGAPWGEIEGHNIIISAPVAALRKLADPERTLAWWDRVVDCYPRLAGTTRHPRKERFVPDVQISAGYMHSGYPVMTWMDVAAKAVGVADGKPANDIFVNGSWGHFHELGHNYQRAEYTWEGAGEVTVNIFTLYAMEKILGKKVREHASVQSAMKRMVDVYRGSLPFAKWISEPFCALLFYIELIEQFGWDVFGKVFTEYAGLAENVRPKTNAERRDQWLVRFSLACGRNIAPHFTKWNIPYGATAARQVANLPAWGGR